MSTAVMLSPSVNEIALGRCVTLWVGAVMVLTRMLEDTSNGQEPTRELIKSIVKVVAKRGSIKQSVLLKAVESELDQLLNETGSPAPR